MHPEDQFPPDDLEAVIDEVVAESIDAIVTMAEERKPWSYLGWVVFAQEDGKPIGIRSEDILVVRPIDGYKCGLSLRTKEKTIVVWGDFLDILDLMPEKIV